MAPNLPPVIIQVRTNLLVGSWEYAGEINATNGVNIWVPPEDHLHGYFRLVVTNAPPVPDP